LVALVTWLCQKRCV